MHVSCSAAIHALLGAHDFEHQAEWIGAASDEGSGAPVVKGHCVLTREVHDNAGVDALLTDPGVVFAGDQAVCPGIDETLFD